MRSLLFLCFIFILVSSVSAVQFSPTNMEFILEKGATSCRTVFVQLDFDTTVLDKWSRGESEWKISNFNLSSEEVNIETDYPQKLDSTEKEIEFCLTASQPGLYRGALIFTQNSEGNSRIQFAIWLSAIVKESDNAPIENNEEGTSSTKSSSKNRKQGSPLYGGGQEEFLSLKNNESREESEKILLEGRVKPRELNNAEEFIFLGIFMLLFFISLAFLFMIVIRKKKLKIKKQSNKFPRQKL